MGKDTGFLEIKKEGVSIRPVEERMRDYREYDKPYSDSAIRDQAARCMDCGIPFCHTGCPLGNMIPDWNDLVYRGNWKEALQRLHSTNNFPEFTGRICPAPCEDSCVLNSYYTLEPEDKQKKKNSVTIEEIEKHIVDYGWEQGWIVPVPPAHETEKHIAIIGSGPAGLAAAQQLRRAGHSVTIFEKEDRPGGLLVYGIPDFKLEKKHIARRVEQMEAEGVVFRTGLHVGKDISVNELRACYDAILLATGAQHPRKLRVEGAELDGVHYAMDYLPQRNRHAAGTLDASEAVDTKDKTGVIIGGGFTGADCLGQLNRQGANNKVYQFELVNMLPRPTPVHEEAEMDCRANTLTEKVIGDSEGKVSALQGVQVEWVKEAGRMSMKRVEGSEFTIKTDKVLLAMGFLGPKIEGLVEGLNLKLQLRGHTDTCDPQSLAKDLLDKDPMYSIASDSNFMTSENGIFVAGDANRGAALVVWAIWEGREAARCIDQYLMGSSNLPTSPQTDSLM